MGNASDGKTGAVWPKQFDIKSPILSLQFSDLTFLRNCFLCVQNKGKNNMIENKQDSVFRVNKSMMQSRHLLG